jgi:NitT/TauT family transport system ATP-binding protein
MSDYSHSYEGNVLRMNDIHLQYGDNVILRGVNASIENVVRPNMTQGQVVGLLGPSGIGKTQLLRIMAGLQEPTKGTITLGPKDVKVERGLVGVVAQNYPLFVHRTVLGNLLVAGKQVGLEGPQAKEKAMGLLDMFGLADRANFYPAQLSGGQRQRVAIAQQVMCSEHVILMDEPFTGLDPLMVDKTIDLIHKVARLDEWNTIIVVTHEISTATAIADTLWVMGRDRTPDGAIIAGAHIKHQIDLIKEGLAWRPEVRKIPRFQEVTSALRDLFREL